MGCVGGFVAGRTGTAGAGIGGTAGGLAAAGAALVPEVLASIGFSKGAIGETACTLAVVGGAATGVGFAGCGARCSGGAQTRAGSGSRGCGFASVAGVAVPDAALAGGVSATGPASHSCSETCPRSRRRPETCASRVRILSCCSSRRSSRSSRSLPVRIKARMAITGIARRKPASTTTMSSMLPLNAQILCLILERLCQSTLQIFCKVTPTQRSYRKSDEI